MRTAGWLICGRSPRMLITFVSRNPEDLASKLVTSLLSRYGSKDPVLAQWAGPALAEGWCAAMLGFSEEGIEKNCAIVIIVAIENFVTKCAEIRRNG